MLETCKGQALFMISLESTSPLHRHLWYLVYGEACDSINPFHGRADKDPWAVPATHLEAAILPYTKWACPVMSASPFTSKTPEAKAGRNVFRKVPGWTMSLSFRFLLSRDGCASRLHTK